MICHPIQEVSLISYELYEEFFISESRTPNMSHRHCYVSLLRLFLSFICPYILITPVIVVKVGYYLIILQATAVLMHLTFTFHVLACKYITSLSSRFSTIISCCYKSFLLLVLFLSLPTISPPSLSTSISLTAVIISCFYPFPVGTCEDMCPLLERKQRIDENDVHKLEYPALM